MTPAAARHVVDRLLLFALSIASRFGRAHPHLRDEFRSEVGLQLWRAALRFASAPDQFGPGLAATVAKRACWRVLKADRSGRRADADVTALPLAGRECDPAFLAEIPRGLRGGGRS